MDYCWLKMLAEMLFAANVHMLKEFVTQNAPALQAVLFTPIPTLRPWKSEITNKFCYELKFVADYIINNYIILMKDAEYCLHIGCKLKCFPWSHRDFYPLCHCIERVSERVCVVFAR